MGSERQGGTMDGMGSGRGEREEVREEGKRRRKGGKVDGVGMVIITRSLQSP